MNKETNVWVILDEANMELLTNETGKALKFNSDKEAEDYASNHCERWRTVQSWFTHPWIQHKANVN